MQYPDSSNPDLSTPTTVVPPPPSIQQSRQSTPHQKLARKQSVSENVPASLGSCSNTTVAASSSLPMPASPPTLLSALRSLYIFISRNPADKGTVAPRAFIDKLKELNELFRSTMHQDAHEFLNYLLNQIMEEMDEDRRKIQNGTANHTINGHGSGSTTGSADTTPSREDRKCFSPSPPLHGCRLDSILQLPHPLARSLSQLVANGL